MHTATVARTTVLIILALASVPAAAEVFYTVTSAEGRQNWLLGTLHSTDPRVVDVPPVVDQALIDAERIVIELVPDELALQFLDRAASLPEGACLSDFLPADLATVVHSSLVARGVVPERARRMQPWAAAMTLSQPIAVDAEFMDLVLARRAFQNGAELLALETIQEQIDFFQTLDLAIHVQMLELAVSAPERLEDQHRQMLELYLARDIDGLQRQAIEQLQPLGGAAAERFVRRGIEQRNERMAERALPLLRLGNTLVAVGALHLPGPGGLIERLRAAGFEVEPIY